MPFNVSEMLARTFIILQLISVESSADTVIAKPIGLSSLLKPKRSSLYTIVYFLWANQSRKCTSVDNVLVPP